jgi:hypothetical protein
LIVLVFEGAGMVGYFYVANGFERVAVERIYSDDRFGFNLAENGKLVRLLRESYCGEEQE